MRRTRPFDVRKAPTRIVTSGIFQKSRNPIYLSMVLLCAGIAFLADSLWLLGLVPLLAARPAKRRDRTGRSLSRTKLWRGLSALQSQGPAAGYRAQACADSLYRPRRKSPGRFSTSGRVVRAKQTSPGRRRRAKSARPALQRFKESVAADRVEMGGDLVEEDERRQSAHRRNEARMCQNQAGKQRFLLSRRSLRRRGLFRAVPHVKIARLRSDQCPSGRGVAGAVAAQNATINIFGFKRRARSPPKSRHLRARQVPPMETANLVSGLQNKSRRRETVSIRAAAIAIASSAVSSSIASSQPRSALSPSSSRRLRPRKARSSALTRLA